VGREGRKGPTYKGMGKKRGPTSKGMKRREGGEMGRKGRGNDFPQSQVE